MNKIRPYFFLLLPILILIGGFSFDIKTSKAAECTQSSIVAGQDTTNNNLSLTVSGKVTLPCTATGYYKWATSPADNSFYYTSGGGTSFTGTCAPDNNCFEWISINAILPAVVKLQSYVSRNYQPGNTTFYWGRVYLNPPTSLATTGQTVNSISYSWTRPVTSNGSFNITHYDYKLYKRLYDPANPGVVTDSGTNYFASLSNATTYTLSGLLANTAYDFGLLAMVDTGDFNCGTQVSCGASRAINLANKRTLIETPTAGGFTCTADNVLTNYRLNVSLTGTYTNLTTANSGILFRIKNSSGTEISNSGWQPVTSWLFQNLTSGTTYTLTAQSRNADSVANSEVTLGTCATSVAVPTGVNATNVDQDSMTWNWTDVSGETSYEVQYKNSVLTSGNWSSTITLGTNAITYIGLSAVPNPAVANTQVTFHIRACNAGGCSAWTADSTKYFAPAIPTIVGENITASSIKWNWNAPSGATTYTFEYYKDSSGEGSKSTFSNLTNSEYTTTGLTNLTLYKGHARACNSETNCSSYSTYLGVTTAACGDNANSEGVEKDTNETICEASSEYLWALTGGNSLSSCWKNYGGNPYMCCGDDTGEFQKTNATMFNSSNQTVAADGTSACCSSQYFCVLNGVCYAADINSSDGTMSGQCYPNDKYCGGPNINFWTQDGDWAKDVCRCLTGSFNNWNDAGWSGTDETRCKCDNDGPCPDLIVQNISVPALMCVGVGATFSATVKNQGSLATGAGFANAITLESATPCTDNTAASLVVNGADNISCLLTPSSSGTKGYGFTADSGSAIIESNESNNSSGGSITVSSTPSAPTGLADTARTANSITWTWNAVSGATSYVIYVDNVLKENDFAGTTYPVNGLVCNTSHTIRITAKNNCGLSTEATDTGSTGACPTTPDFSLTVNEPTSRTIQAPLSSTTFTISLTSYNNFSGSVSLSVGSTCPSGTTCSFSPASVVLAAGGTGSSTLTVSNLPAPLSTQTITVTGTSGALTHSANARVTVTGCDNNNDCPATICQADGCYGDYKWDDYPATVANTCVAGTCTTNPSCTPTTQTCSIASCGAECESNNCSTTLCNLDGGHRYLQTRAATCGSNCTCPAWSAYQSCQQSYNTCTTPAGERVECYTGTGCNIATNSCLCQTGYTPNGSGGCTALPSCPNGTCGAGETCANCPADCGACNEPPGDIPATPPSPPGTDQYGGSVSIPESGCTTDSTPYFSFTISDPDTGDTVGYQIQIDDSATFASPIIDFTWDGSTTNPNTVSFVVPSTCPAPLGGYAACTAPLPVGTYYWRVRALDNNGNFSNWTNFGTASADFEYALACGSGNLTAGFSYCKYANRVIQFINTTSGGAEPYTSSWNFGDGQTCVGSSGCNYGSYSGKADHPVHYFSPSAWSSKRKITFANAGRAALTDFPVLIRLNSSRIDYTKTKDDGSDLRFWDSDGTTALDYEIEKWNEAGESLVWVRVPEIASSDSDYIWMYYGNPAANDEQDAAGVWNANYKMVQHLNETTGIHYDSTSNINDSTSVSGNPVQGAASGRADGADSFDGTGDRINTKDFDSDSITVEAWVKFNAFSDFDKLANKDGGGLGSWSFVLDSNAPYYMRWSVYNENNSELTASASSATLNTGVWYYFAGTYQKASGDGTLYRDGSFLDDVNGAANKAIRTNANSVVIGGSVLSSDQTINGVIDEVRISDTDRSADWINATYASINDDPSNPFATFDDEQVAMTEGSVAGMTDQKSGADQTDEQTEKPNLLEKIWQWLKNLFNVLIGRAQTVVYDVILTVTDASGSPDSETQTIDLSSAPACAFNLTTVSAGSCERVDGEWATLSGFDAASDYTVYRCPGSGTACDQVSEFSAVNTNKACGANCSFEDTSVVGSNEYSYYLTLTAINLRNSLASGCNGATALCPLSATTPVCPVNTSGLTATSRCGAITIGWEEVAGSLGYQIRRAIGSASGTYTIIATINDGGTTTYEDKNVITVNTTNPSNQFRYFYQLSSQAESGEWSDWSDAFPANGIYSYCYREPSWQER
jgi:hypothetical protein